MPENPTKHLSLNDSPSLEDFFHNDFIDRLCPLISDSQAPKGIAITGYWGAGKTSTLRQLYYNLSGEIPPGCGESAHPDSPRHLDKTLVPIWFEAWRFQHEQQPVVALLNEIRVKIGLLQKFAGEGEKLASVALLGALNVFDEVIKLASNGFKTGAAKVMEIGEKWENERYMNKLPSQKINDLLEQAIENTLGKANHNKRKRLLIFVDDLDRCLPTSALRLLEGIKIYLNLSNCIFVFGMDHRQLHESLLASLPWIEKTHNEDKRRGVYFVQEYLEKICQDIHYLPVLSQGDKALYFIKLLDTVKIGEEQDAARHISRIRSILNKYDCLPANPRKIKMLVNRTALTIRSVLSENVEAAPDPGVVDRQYMLLLITAIIYTFFKQVYEQLEHHPSYINDVLSFSAANGDQRQDDRFKPMEGIVPAKDGNGGPLPVNPSDSNVFRVHEMLTALQVVTEDEIKPYLRLNR